MRSMAILLCCVTLLDCRRSATRSQRARQTTDMQTIDSVQPEPVVLDPPPMLTDEGPAPKPKGDVTQPDAPPPPTPQDEALRASLPFAPAIGLDPVEGSKISIRASSRRQPIFCRTRAERCTRTSANFFQRRSSTRNRYDDVIWSAVAMRPLSERRHGRRTPD